VVGPTHSVSLSVTTTYQRSFSLSDLAQHRYVRALLADKLTLAAVIVVFTAVFVAIFAPYIAPTDPYAQELENRLRPPFSSIGSRIAILGTDQLGRDELSRLIYAGRISLTLGLAGVLVSGAIGVLLGVIAGFFRGTCDDVIMRAVDVFMSVPTLLTALIVLYALGPSFQNMILFFAFARWMLFCRIARSAVLSLREQPFVESARAIGCGEWRILLRHILPNGMTPIVIVASMEVARNILTESTLSFLGMGVQPPESSWGLMLAQGQAYIVTAWWVVLIPGLAIVLVALSFNLVGAWTRAMTDPVQRVRWTDPTPARKARYRRSPAGRSSAAAPVG
jgi:peptide/nickel transport system permease protein